MSFEIQSRDNESSELEDTVNDPNTDHVAQAASLLSDELRLSIVLAIRERPQSVNALVAQTGALQPRVSSHLAILREAGWVVAERAGRQTIYRLTDPAIGAAIDALEETPMDASQPRVSPQAEAAIRRAGPVMQQARTCYDHLAGIAGVTLCDALLERDWIEPHEDESGGMQPGYQLTSAGRDALSERGVAIPEGGSKRRFAYACPDWTERRPHVAGALGAAILTTLEQQGYLRRAEDSRTVHLERDIDDWLDR